MNVAAAITAIDALHREDPAGQELTYAQRMSYWLHELDQQPDPLLQIAVRAQHLKRWEYPRAAYPDGRDGYLTWRAHAAAAHAELVAGILRSSGFDNQAIARVTALVMKQNLGRDDDVQTLEDCACLTFLELGLTSFRRKHPLGKVDHVLARTWRKMSPAAHRAAAAFVPQPPA